MMHAGPDIAKIRALRDALTENTLQTPTVRAWALEQVLGGDTRVTLKLELLQRTGTFKARGALATLRNLSEQQLARGVTAVSAGNHAIATAYAARVMGTTAKVVMIQTANPSRIESCRDFGAEVVLADDVHHAFDVVERIQNEEGRIFVHPFEGVGVALGTGTVGLEICEQVDDFDALVVPVGGGGLIGGIANAVQQLRPGSTVIGVEPEGADTMRRSFDAGEPCSIERITTIADSLGAPFALPYSYELTRRNVERIVLVDDTQLRRSMGFLFRAMKFAVEPACAATTAALLWPLRESLRGKHVVLVLCGSNIDWPTFEAQAIFDDDIH